MQRWVGAGWEQMGGGRWLCPPGCHGALDLCGEADWSPQFLRPLFQQDWEGDRDLWQRAENILFNIGIRRGQVHVSGPQEAGSGQEWGVWEAGGERECWQEEHG